MVILVNGAFGIGKTTVARLLSQRMARSAIYDPELIGIALQRFRRAFGVSVHDFQDLKSWRRLTVLGVRATRLLRSNVIVPMAFSNLDYLQEIRTSIKRFEPRVYHFCLVAPVEVVSERLKSRGQDRSIRDMAWQYRRAADCCVAHAGPGFAERVRTEQRTAEEVANYILEKANTETSTG